MAAVALPAAALTLALAGGAAGQTAAGFTIAPSIPAPRQAVTLTAAVPCVAPVTCTWSGDDRLAGTGPEIVHTYATAGRYRVILTVDDPGDGARRFEERIAVVEGNVDPVADFEATTSELTARFDATSSSDADQDTLTYTWDFGDGSSGDGAVIAHSYAAAGRYRATLSVGDGRGGIARLTRVIDVSRAPAAAFTVLPEQVRAGDLVRFASTSSDPEGGVIDERWDLDGDGAFDDARGSGAERRFDAAGTFTVGLRVEDEDGNATTAFAQVDVGPAAPLLPPPPVLTPVEPTPEPTPAAPRSPRLLAPFPSLRVAGQITARGAVLRLVTLNAPRAARVVTTCRGRGCAGARHAMRGGRLRLRHLQRSYRAGSVLEVRVIRSGYVGKYTRIVVRRHRAPLRRDLCLYPGSTTPRKCPSR